MGHLTWLRPPILLLAFLVLATPAFAAGQESARSAAPGLKSRLASLWLSFSGLISTPAELPNRDRGPDWDPWGSKAGSPSSHTDPDRGPGWDPWG
jgi:hypothetical protein